MFSCEVKVPTNPQGASPYDHEVVDGARRKAETEGLPYFGALNCASFVLWQVDMPGVPVYSRGIDRWRVVEPQYAVNQRTVRFTASWPSCCQPPLVAGAPCNATRACAS